jgi:hypothetical protein
MTRRSFPGAVVDAAITLARLPADLVLSAAGEGPVTSLVGAGVDAADGAARGVAATLLGDEQLRRDAERRLDEAESSVADELAI